MIVRFYMLQNKKLLNMFHNSNQSIPFFQIFDAKAIKQKDKLIFKVTNPNLSIKSFNKQLKNYVLDLEGANNKISFPKQDRQQLYLLQQYLIIQMYIHSNANFGMELIISDINKTKRRVIFTYNQNKIEIKPFFIKIPNQKLKRDKWINICIDLFSFILPFKDQIYRSLDNIYINGSFKIRKIYTSRIPLNEISGDDNQQESKSSLFPKNFSFPSGIPFSTQLLNYYQYIQSYEGKNIPQYETDGETYAQYRTSHKFDNPKTDFQTTPKQFLKERQTGKSVGQKKFLANTNSSQLILKLKRRQQKNQQNIQKINSKTKINRQLVQSNIQLKNNVQNIRKNSIQKKLIKKILPNLPKYEKYEAKINPWRAKQNQQEVKQQICIQNDQHQIHSEKLNPFKKNNQIKIRRNLQDCKINTNNTKKPQNTIYSDSDYLQLSQKFSTITDPKFFKPDLKSSQKNFSQPLEKAQKKMQQQIQQQLQMNSVQSTHRGQQIQKEKIPNLINTLNEIQKSNKNEYINNFLEQHLREIIKQIERPYSPPLTNMIEQPLPFLKQDHNKKHQNIQSKQIQLIYDPVLKCYYDFKTNTYYELKPS